MRLAPERARRIDALFAEWDRKDRPGAVVAILRRGHRVYDRAFGMASIELGVPNRADTVFRIASVTKHFACLAALMLAEEGKLDLDDPLRRYLPDLPKSWPRVTVRHAMHNVSGLRDHLAMTMMVGSGLDAAWPEAEIDALIRRQKGLNFPPNTRFLYSNAGFRLVTQIVEKISGKEFGEFLAARLFRPLGMTGTRLVRDRHTVVPGLANNYLRLPDGKIIRAAFGYPMSGDGGLVSSVDDLVLWSRAWDGDGVDPHLAATMQNLQSLDLFADGSPQNYGFGLAIERYRGLMTTGHGGLLPGYRTEFLRIPQREFAIVVIANVDAIDPYVAAHRIIDIVLADDPDLMPVPKAKPEAKWAGRWVDAARDVVLDLKVEKGRLLGDLFGGWFAYRPLPGGRWKVERGVFPATLRFRPGTVKLDQGAGHIATLKKARPPRFRAKDYAGRYHAADLATDYQFEETKGGGLALRIRGAYGRSGPFPVNPVAPDVFLIEARNPPFAVAIVAHFERKGRRVIGLTLSGARIKGLGLKRVG